MDTNVTVNANRPIVKLKLDVIFKRVFGDAKNEDIIASMLSALLEIPRENIRHIEIQNVELPPEELGRKFSRLDLKLNVDNKTVNVEMQVNYEPDFRDRTLFYWARMFGEELKEGALYGDLKPTYCVNIINFNLLPCKEYHSFYQPLEKTRHDLLSDHYPQCHLPQRGRRIMAPSLRGLSA